MRLLKEDSNAMLPLIAILVIIGIVLIGGLMVVAYLTMKLIIVGVLLLIGVLFVVKPQLLSGVSPAIRIALVLLMFVLAIIVYSGVVAVG